MYEYIGSNIFVLTANVKINLCFKLRYTEELQCCDRHLQLQWSKPFKS